MPTIDINSDLGEGFGAYAMGDDDALLAIVSSANVACGFHAGDPMVMARTCEQARRHGVSVGAHPGFPDLQGFGRRIIPMSEAEIESMVAYQIGGLMGIAARAGIPVAHVKAHGALYNLAEVDTGVAAALARAVKAVDPNLIFVAAVGSYLVAEGERLGLRVVREAFADRTYADDGRLVSRKLPGSVLRDAASAADHVMRMVTEQALFSLGGKRIPAQIDTICVHGDEPTAVAVATGVKQALTKAGFTIAAP
ncbi:MAG TPA: 5-oxoprolinase subunit PxpA [Stellaceae bacterium]|nr:5-oxoprolinase subunit PxpA [Stellaceae bacterium]